MSETTNTTPGVPAMRKSLEELAREITANTIHLISGEDIKNVVASYLRDLLPEGHVVTRDGQDVVVETQNEYDLRRLHKAAVNLSDCVSKSIVWKWARERGWYWGKMEPGKTDWNSEYWAGQVGGEYIYVPDTGNFHDDLFQLFDKVLDAIEAKGGKAHGTR